MPPRTEAEVRASMDALLHDVERDKRIYGWFAGNVGELAHGMKDLASRMEFRFEQVDQRFEQIDQRFEQIDQRFAEVDRRFEQVDQRFAEVDRRFDNVDRQFGLVHDSLRSLDARMERLVRYIIRDELGAGDADEGDPKAGGRRPRKKPKLTAV